MKWYKRHGTSPQLDLGSNHLFHLSLADACINVGNGETI